MRPNPLTESLTACGTRPAIQKRAVVLAHLNLDSHTHDMTGTGGKGKSAKGEGEKKHTRSGASRRPPCPPASRLAS